MNSPEEMPTPAATTPGPTMRQRLRGGSGRSRTSGAGKLRAVGYQTILNPSWMSRGRLFWLVTLPKLALVGSVFGVVEDDDVERVQELDVELRRGRGRRIGTCLTIEMSHSFRNGLRSAVDARREVADVAREPDARVGALLDRVVHAVGLHRGVVEVEAADVEHRHRRRCRCSSPSARSRSPSK